MNIELKAKDSFILEGNKKAWLVREGAVNVFLTKILPDGSFGRKSWLFTAVKGQMLAGFDFRPDNPCRIVAGAAPMAVLEEKPIDFLASDAEDRAPNARLLDGWAENITFALVGYKLPPKSLEFIDPGEAIAMKDNSSYGARPGEVLWVKLIEGEVEALGSYLAFFAGHAGYFPVTNRFWFKIYTQNAGSETGPSISARRTQNFLEQPDIACSIAAFHSIVLWLLIEKTENSESEEISRLEKRTLRDAAIVDRSLSGFASIVDPGFEGASPADADNGEFAAACMLVGAASKIEIVIPPAIKKGETIADPVAETARFSMVRHRKVLLRDDWWTKDAGPLLAYLEDGRPAALIPQSASSYKLHIPGSGKVLKVGRAEAAMLSGIAYVFYRPLPARPLGIRDISRYAMDAGIFRDAALMVLAGTALSIINMLTPMATSIAFDTLIPEIERTQMVQTTAILISASVCILMVQFFRSIATLRFENKIDASLQAAVWDRLLALPAPFFRKFSSGDLAMRAMSINSIRQTISGTVFSSLLTGTFSVLNFFLLFYYSKKLALTAAGLALIAVLFYFSVLLLQYNYSKRIMELDGKLSGLIFGIISGMAKFRVAGAESRAFGMWAKFFKEKKEIPSYMLTNLTTVFNSTYTLVCSMIFFWCIVNYPQSDQTMSSGAFTAFSSAFATFFAGMTEISSSTTALLSAYTLYERAKPILEAVPEFDEAKEDPGELNGAVEISGVTFKYEGSLLPALSDVSMSIK
ncbi:MAG TPA: ABC transporter transmembrane domain-containing protein, partial [Candidatus Wallbacteria bacterium]|nr:ABC transporter transmembrane domain-containing protein [Candidatus Wallbacteria bacterium]